MKQRKGEIQKVTHLCQITHVYVQNDASKMQSDTSLFSVVQSDAVVVACDTIYSTKGQFV